MAICKIAANSSEHRDISVTLTWEDRLKVLLMPGWIYYQRKLASEARKGEPEITILPELLLSRGKVAVDVGGTEVEVLEGARETIQRDRPLMMVEILAGLYDNPARVVQELCVQYGYQARILSDDGLVDALGHLQAGLPVSSRNVLFFPHE